MGAARCGEPCGWRGRLTWSPAASRPPPGRGPGQRGDPGSAASPRPAPAGERPSGWCGGGLRGAYRPCVPEPYAGLFPCQTDHPPCHGGSRSASRFASFLGCPECPVWPGFSPDEGERSAPRGPPAHAPHGVGTMPGRWAGGRGPRRCTACVAWDAQAAGGHRLHKDPRPRPGRPALGRGGRTAHNYLASVQVMSDRTRPPKPRQDILYSDAEINRLYSDNISSTSN